MILPIILYASIASVVIAGLLIASYLLGTRHSGGARNETYESGLIPTGTARIRFPVHFYLIAMFFVIFDVEAIFLFAWAVSAREAGWTGLVEIGLFVSVLLLALAYLWRSGGLDFTGRHLTGDEGRTER